MRSRWQQLESEGAAVVRELLPSLGGECDPRERQRSPDSSERTTPVITDRCASSSVENTAVSTATLQAPDQTRTSMPNVARPNAVQPAGFLAARVKITKSAFEA